MTPAPLHRALAALLGLPDAAALPARVVAFAAEFPDDALVLARGAYRTSAARRLGVFRRDLRTPWMLARVCGDPLAARAVEVAAWAPTGRHGSVRALRRTADRVRRHLREPVALPCPVATTTEGGERR